MPTPCRQGRHHLYGVDFAFVFGSLIRFILLHEATNYSTIKRTHQNATVIQVRLKVLDQAEALLFKYLDTCDRLELFEEADGQVWQSMSKDGERFASGGRQIMTRDKKIERFR